MKSTALLSALLLTTAEWQTGKRTGSEKQEVHTGNTTTYDTDKSKDGSKSGTATPPATPTPTRSSPSRPRPGPASSAKG